MPQYLSIPNWNNLSIEVRPAETWRQRLRFWPYFVGQKINLELVIRQLDQANDDSLQFHIVEKVPDNPQPRIITPTTLPGQTEEEAILVGVQSDTRITGKGEIKYWISNKGYHVDHDPIFIAEAINLDSMIIQVLAMAIGPFFCFIAGLVLSFIIRN